MENIEFYEFIVWCIKCFLGGVLVMAVVATACMVLAILARHLIKLLKEKTRRWKVDARIVRQAKAVGVWDKPKVLGGRALELRALWDYGIRRNPGESDKELRARYMAAADEEYANEPDWRDLENG